ncbi:heme exporter protein D [Gammaproteobacteria bacterium]
MREFFQMGGYAFYVWLSYGLAIVILIFNLLSPLWRRREILQTLTRRLRHEREAS